MPRGSFGTSFGRLAAPLLRPARGVTDAIEARWRLWRLSHHVAALRAASNDALTDPGRLAAMRHVWGNEGWSADLEYLRAVVGRMRGVTGPVLECGSGLTTIVSGVLAERRGVQIMSLEQDPSWADFVQSRLARLGISTVTVVHVPLRTYEGFVWFDVDALKFPDRFELAICDGPAVYGHEEPYQTAWRVGLLPVLRDRGVRIAQVLMDDADDVRAGALQEHWKREHHCRIEVTHTPTGDYLTAHPERDR